MMSMSNFDRDEPGRYLIAIGSPHCSNLGLDFLPAVESDIDKVAKLLTDRSQGYKRVLADQIPLGMTSQVIKSALSAWFSSPERRASDCVIIYYAGHGDEGGRFGDHYLLTVESHESNLLNTAIETRSLIKSFFQGNNTPPQNILLILDVCYAGIGQQQTLTALSKLESVRAMENSIWLIASSTDTKAGDGTFVAALETVMKMEHEHDREFLEMERLIELLNQHFETTQQAQRARGIATFKGQSCFIRNPRSTRLQRSLSQLQERDSSIDQLLSVLPQPRSLEDSLWQAYELAYQRCCPEDWHLSHPMPETVNEILEQIGEMSHSELTISGKPVTRQLEFVARILNARTSLSASQIAALQQWGQEQSAAFPNLLNQINTRPQQTQLLGQGIAEPCLIVEVHPESLSYNTRAFLIPNSHAYSPNAVTTWIEVRPWNFKQKQEDLKDLRAFNHTKGLKQVEKELKQRVADYIITCRRKHREIALFRLELILPEDLINLSIEDWQLESGGFISTIVPWIEFPVVVRSYERTTETYREELGSEWEEKWQKLKYSSGLAADNLADFPSQWEASHLRAAYLNNSKTIGFKLAGTLQRPAQTKRFFKALLGAAVPVAVWCRGTVEQQMAIESVDTWLDCSLRGLPEHFRKLRSLSSEKYHLSLLWENPNLLPPLLSVPKQRSR